MSFRSDAAALGFDFDWRAQESSGATVLVDSSGNGRNGVFGTPSGTLTFGQAGLVPNDAASESVDFSGQVYGDVAYGSWMNGSTLTILGFIDPDAVGSDYQIADRDGSTRIFQFRITNSGNLEVIWWTTSSGPHFLSTSNGVLTTTDPHIVGLTIDGSNTRLWACNVTTEVVTKVSTTNSGNLQTGTTPLAIGASRGGSGVSTPAFNFLDGKHGGVLYKASALTETQVDNLIASALEDPSISGSFSANVAGVTSDLAGTVELPVVEGVFSAQVAGLTSDLTGDVDFPLIEGAFGAQVGGVTSELFGGEPFVPFEPPTVGAGFPLRFSARLTPPLSVDVDDVVPFRRVAASVSED